MARKLTAKQDAFCTEYLLDLDATAAAKRAGYSAKTASQQGYQLLQKTSVAARISELKAERTERLRIEADTVLRELLILATSSVNNYSVDDDGRIEMTDGASPEAVRAVASVKITRTPKAGGDEVKTEYRLWDKNTALANLGKHLGIFEADNKQKTPDTIRWELHSRGDD